ncbi:MAG: HEAT repeat domain-containing protein [Planctomycetota bacterium]
MKIYFCDICNESIPLKDLEEGTCLAVKGKMICSSCNPMRGGGAKSGLSAWPGIVAIVIALAALGLAIFSWLEKQPDDSARSEATRDLERSIQEVGRKLEGVTDRVALLEEQKEEPFPIGRLEELEALQKTGGRRLAELDAEIESVRGLLETQAGLQRELERVSLESTDFASRLDKTQDRQDGLERAVEGLAARLEGMALAPRGDVVMPEPAEEKEPEAKSGARDVSIFDDRTRALIDQLASGNPSVRFNAVDELLRLRDERLAPWLVDQLEDDDMFVRYLIAEGLGELGRKDVCSALIERLDDPESIVRDSAHRSLETLLGLDVSYDPNGTVEERRAGVTRWKKAWDDVRGTE